jgi:general secretion pathway protein A
MYLKHFGLKAQPFQLTPDIGFLFMSEAHTRAKVYMDYTVWNREGFVVITGEIGCGKTTLIQKLLSELNKNVVVAKIFQTQLDEVEFLQAVLVEFGLNPFNAKKVELLDMLNTFLIQHFVQGKQIVLIVDDAHNLSTKVLEEIRMLAGLETRK